MSRQWWNKNEHIRWKDYRYHYHRLPIWARKWGNWLGMGNISTDDGDPIDEYLKRTMRVDVEKPVWLTLWELEIDDWQLDFQRLSPEKLQLWFQGDYACLVGHPVIYTLPMRPLRLLTRQAQEANELLYRRIGFLRPIRHLRCGKVT